MLRFALLIVVTAVFATSGAQAAQPLQLMANTSPPYVDASLPEQGLALELVKHIYAGTDYAPQFTIEDWSQALEGARLGVYDALASAWYSKEREKDLLFSAPYLPSKLLVLKLRSKPGVYSSLQDLVGSRLGVRKNYAYGVDFSAIPKLKLVEDDQLAPLLLKLLNGQVDFVIADQRSAAMELHQYFADRITQFVVVDMELPSVARHVAASRSWPDHEKMIAQFNRALAAAQKDGSLEAIIKKWDARYGGME